MRQPRSTLPHRPCPFFIRPIDAPGFMCLSRLCINSLVRLCRQVSSVLAAVSPQFISIQAGCADRGPRLHVCWIQGKGSLGSVRSSPGWTQRVDSGPPCAGPGQTLRAAVVAALRRPPYQSRGGCTRDSSAGQHFPLRRRAPDVRVASLRLGAPRAVAAMGARGLSRWA